MSLKSTLHCTPVLRPKLASKYMVLIEGFWSSPIQVEQCDVPFPNVDSISVNFFGRQFNIPATYDQQGSWSCTIPETMFMTSTIQSSLLLNGIEHLDYKPRKIIIFLLDDIIGAVPLYYCVLGDCFLTNVDRLSLSWQTNQPVKYKLTFSYSSISRLY